MDKGSMEYSFRFTVPTNTSVSLSLKQTLGKSIKNKHTHIDTK